MEHNKLHTKKGKLSSVTYFTSILNMILKEVQLQENGTRFKIFVMIYSGLVLVFQVFMESVYTLQSSYKNWHEMQKRAQ